MEAEVGQRLPQRFGHCFKRFGSNKQNQTKILEGNKGKSAA
jgi:hypothetical protein